MAVKFNPFTGQLQIDEKGSGGGGGSSVIEGEVNTYNDLPLDGSAALNSSWLVRTASGSWFTGGSKPAGIYVRVNTAGSSRDNDYVYAGLLPSAFSDTDLKIYDNSDSTKTAQFQLSGITAGQNRVLTVPNSSGTIQLTGHAAAHGTTGSDPIELISLAATGTGEGDLAVAQGDGTVAWQNGTDWAVLNITAADIGAATSSHTHGNLTNAGAIGSTSGLPVVTTTSGAITTLALGSAGQVLKVNSGGTAVEFGADAGGISAIGASAADILSVSGSDLVADDPNADRLVFWDDSASKLAYLEVGSGLSISGTTITATASGGSKTYAVFSAEHNQPPSTAFATLDTRNSIAVLDFDDATDESAVFVGVIPEGASLGSGLKIRLHWMATSATSGNCVWDVSLERMTTDLDSDSFDTIASATAAANGTSGILTVTEITLTTIDSVTAGDGFRLKVTRDANNASDTMTGDAELVLVEVRSAA